MFSVETTLLREAIVASRLLTRIAALFVAATLVACSGSQDISRIGQPAPPDGYGVVQDVELVDAPKEINWLGTLAGAAIGGIIGHQIGGGRGQDIATGAGAVAGALAGQKLTEKPPAKVHRVNVRMDDGSYRVAYGDPAIALKKGERVFVTGDRAVRR